jgi:hypothetical protein
MSQPLPDLLRHLARAAHSRDARIVKTMMEALSRHRGWFDAVADFIDRMPSRDAAFVAQATAEPASPGVRGHEPRTAVTIPARDRPDPWPMDTAMMALATGNYGTWSAGWQFNEASGNLLPAFGSTTFTTSATTRTYQNQGPLCTANKAIGFGDTTGAWSAGNVLNVTAAQDLFVIIGLTRTGATAGQPAMLLKYAAGTYWGIAHSGANLILVSAGAGLADLGAEIPTDTPGLLGAVIERGTARMHIAWRSLNGTSTLTSGEQVAPASDCTNANPLYLGANANSADPAATNYQWFGMSIGVGASAAVGASANLPTILNNFANYLKGT